MPKRATIDLESDMKLHSQDISTRTITSSSHRWLGTLTIAVILNLLMLLVIASLPDDRILIDTGSAEERSVPATAAPDTNSQYRCSPGKPGSEVAVIDTSHPHILIGVLMRNREPYQETFAHSLDISLARYPEWIPYVHIRVYDDGSANFSSERILEKFPTAERILHIHGKHAGQNGAGITRVFHLDCIKTEYDLCIVGDSDTIFHPDWIPTLVRNINKTDGQLTLYNSCSHETLKRHDEICEKKSFGGAGAVLTRKLLTEIECNIIPWRHGNDPFDYSWSVYMRNTSRKNYALCPSMLEHIGIHFPSWGVASRREQSVDFDPFALPQPLSTILYYHLESRRGTSCNISKGQMPVGWRPQEAFSFPESVVEYFLDQNIL